MSQESSFENAWDDRWFGHPPVVSESQGHHSTLSDTRPSFFAALGSLFMVKPASRQQHETRTSGRFPGTI